MPPSRDPASELLDSGARRLLARAYAARTGTWVMTRLADPSQAHLDWAQDIGLDNLLGPDRPTTANGTHVQAHTRWGRAFMRALWFQHRWYGDKDIRGFRGERRMTPYGIPLQVDWGRRMPAIGVIPAGRAVRIRIAAGGATKLRVVRSKPDSARIFADDGTPAGRWADPAKRDWLGLAMTAGERRRPLKVADAGFLVAVDLARVGDVVTEALHEGAELVGDPREGSAARRRARRVSR